MHTYTKEESVFIQTLLDYGEKDGSISEDQKREMRKDLDKDYRDIVTAYFQEKHNQVYYLRKPLVVDGLYGRNTGNALKAVMREEVEEVKKTDASFDILDAISKALPLWADYAHDKVVTHFTDAFEMIGDDLGKVNLDDYISLSIFMGQMAHETGIYFTTVENLNYSCKALPRIFKYYRLNPRKSVKHGRCRNHKANQNAIANHAYAYRYGNGDPVSGDGALFKGGGAFQLTFRNNYQGYHDWLKATLPRVFEASQGDLIMTEGVRIVRDSPHSVLSAIYYFNKSGMYEASKHGLTRLASDHATRKINLHTTSYHHRWDETKKAYKLMTA